MTTPFAERGGAGPPRGGPVGARLALVDAVAIGINGIIGSGIYLLPGVLYALAGPASIGAFVAAGILCLLVALCFAEAAGMFERSGGPYLYVREGLGEVAGFAVGWVCVFTGVLAFAAVARGLFEQVALFVPAMTGTWQAPIAAAFIAALGLANAAGLRVGATIADVISFAKLAPLLFFAFVGLFYVHPPASAQHAAPTAGGFFSAAMVAVFCLSGFEFIPVPAGETRDARRSVPLAILGTLVGATVLYAIIQTVAIGAHPALSLTTRPLSEAGAAMWGGWGERLMAAGAIVSTVGFCTSSALVGPRYATAIAEDGLLPRVFAWRDRRGTPLTAIALNSGGAAVLAALFDFRRLVDVTSVVLFLQFLPTCVSVLVMRWTRPDVPRKVRLPVAVPILAIVSSAAMVANARELVPQLVFIGKVLAAGGVVYLVMRLARRRA